MVGVTASAPPPPAPTGVALTALASTATLFHMGLLHTVGVIGLLVVGYLGIWRSPPLFPTAAGPDRGPGRVCGSSAADRTAVDGRWGALACYAAVPWVVHLLRRAAGIESFGLSPTAHEARRLTRRRATSVAVRMLCQLAVLTAVTFAFVPSFGLVVVAVGVVLALAQRCSPVARGGRRCTRSMSVAAQHWRRLANLPWASSFFGRHGWDRRSPVSRRPSPTAYRPGSVGSSPRSVSVSPGSGWAMDSSESWPRPVPARSRRAARGARAGGSHGPSVPRSRLVFGRLAVLDDRGLEDPASPNRACCWPRSRSEWRCPRHALLRRSRTTCLPGRSAGASRSACSARWRSLPSGYYQGWPRSVHGRCRMPHLDLDVGARPVPRESSRRRLSNPLDRQPRRDAGSIVDLGRASATPSPTTVH